MQTCDVCGKPLAPQTGRGGRRKRHPECSKRRLKPQLAQIPAKIAAEPETTREAVLAELRAAGLMGKPESLQALSIATRLDSGSEPGSAHAALSKELRALLAELRKEQTAEVDIFDQLAERRAANGRAAGGA